MNAAMLPAAAARPRVADAARGQAQLAAACRPARRGAGHRAGRPVRIAAAADDSEVAVFRFTLGNDTADALVPRVVGGVGAAALLLNHLLSSDAPSEAQVKLGQQILLLPASATHLDAMLE